MVIAKRKATNNFWIPHQNNGMIEKKILLHLTYN